LYIFHLTDINWPSTRSQPKARIVAKYDYTDAYGTFGDIVQSCRGHFWFVPDSGRIAASQRATRWAIRGH
jgi:hypothetical protein